jgi:hypothetical protein
MGGRGSAAAASGAESVGILFRVDFAREDLYVLGGGAECGSVTGTRRC